ncbi:serpin family protein [Cuneatibacter caecimuris]|uniref:Serpin B n=1 Tax=Cuneatibacter caecimuris TaxID=1796618 RepID=A0A4Q7NZ49_9FIRM|nr:serpin family protein [Cuneatibacter caecimuris]RZS92723.1 serpin B [Cuneatibacter caecimuris]
MKRRGKIKTWGCLLMAMFLVLGTAGCGSQEKPARVLSLMEGIEPLQNKSQKPDEEFYDQVSNFSVTLFQKICTGEKSEMAAPLSVLAALSMTANGARGGTLEEMLQVMAGKMKLEDWNSYLSACLAGQGEELSVADSVWFRDGLEVQKDFLQANADYYQAGAYQGPFDEETRGLINEWVEKNTHEMIREALKEIDGSTVMYLINALAFEGKWETVYQEGSVREGVFTSKDGEAQTAEMMHSMEYRYVKAEQGEGIVKPYKGGRYGFLAVLPDEGVKVEEFVSSLTGEKLRALLESQETTSVQTTLPAFSYDTNLMLNQILSEMGMPSAFEAGAADFNGIVKNGGIFVEYVSHSTHITVDKEGTRAAAVTIVAAGESAALPEHEISFDRPFFYAIVDLENNVPVMLGTVTEI